MPIDGALYGALFVAGLTGSLHCLGMCGPILIGLSAAAGPPGEEQRRVGAGVRAMGEALGSVPYHAGRIWTYALLGFAAGWAGSRLQGGSAVADWQRPIALVASAAVVLAGVAAIGWLPRLKLDLVLRDGCFGTLARWPFLAALARTRGPLARLLLGAVMGLLPCGLVYAALVVVATLPGPLHGAFGMICFGAGTLPALTALVAARGSVPGWLRARSPRLAGAVLLGVGLLMLGRSILL